uniref:Uncharacterized protein n=1 Tax=Mola mola TaxID=94237 RepID=A0A3Q3X3J3_MOLML
DSNEDSVDIYDGLDINPSSNAEKSSPSASQLKESMDLYEEIVTEEQQSRESTYFELKSRFQAAQNQIKELRRRLENVELKNTGLNTENCRLKKNISALLRTARLEVTRKDAEIQRLIQRSEKGRCHHQFHINNLRDQNLSSQSFTGSLKTRTPLPPAFNPVPPPPLPHLQTSSPRNDCPLQEPSQPSRKECDNSTNPPSRSCVETTALKTKTSSHSHSKSSSRGDSSTRHSESERHKYKHRERKCQSQKRSESTDRRHTTGSEPSNSRGSEKNRAHKLDRSTGKTYDSGSCKSKKYLNVEGRHRSDRTKSPPSEIFHTTASSDDNKERNREKRQDKTKLSTSDSEHCVTHSSKDCYIGGDRKIKTTDLHRSSDSKGQLSSSQYVECYSDSAKERRLDRLSKDYPRKEERQHKDEIRRKHKRSTSSETKRDCEKQSSKESDQSKVYADLKKRQEKAQQTLKRSCEKTSLTEKSSVQENSPNRKLCFMETLNLTLSPIKKLVLPNYAKQDDLTSVDNVFENEPNTHESSQPNIEDLCVVDEIDSCELEAGLEVTDQSPNIPHCPESEKIQSCEDVKDVHQEDKNRCKTPTADKQLNDHPIQITSTHNRLIDSAENQITVHFTYKSPESLALKTNRDKSKSYEDETKPASDRQLVKFGSVETKTGVTGSHEKDTRSYLQKVNPRKNTDSSIALTESVVLESSVEVMESVKTGASVSLSRENPVTKDIPYKSSLKSQQISIIVLPQDCQQRLCTSASSPIQEKDADAVSSTIRLQSLPQEELSLPDAIYILTQTSEDAKGSVTVTSEHSSSTTCIAVSKVSSTTQEAVLPEKYSDVTFTPKKSFSPGKIHENNSEPSSSMALLHDEDSMMHTLSNLKRMPDAISPLRSPIRISKRSHLHHSNQRHVKSLEKDFSSTAVDGDSKTLDVNKENKYLGSSANQDAKNLVDKVSDLPSSLSDTELEEGEIFSESDEMALDSPVPTVKRAKLTRTVRNKPSPSTVLNRTRSPKSRFKTVCPAATKFSFSTIEEVMETFKLVRAEIRKKYMKLHKTFPKKSFYGVMDNFRESFLEFVDGANFGQISTQQGELKSKMKKVIVTVFNKVSNNGIVKRIFEQQAVDLKQKLWDFVDVQVEYLFQDIYTAMKTLCRPVRAQAESSRPSRKENVPRHSPITKSQCHQKETQATTDQRIMPSTVVPYKTGLGSRGKDIRITHLDKERNVNPHPTNSSNRQTVVSFNSPKNIPSTPEKNNISSLVVSHNGSLLDKTDFELLTEQQASSLTFNLVRDTQMGEIFKCLLQGSNLLESSAVTGDNTTWPLGTPRKDGERFISIATPTKFDSPSKFLSTSNISPHKMSSPQPKNQILLNPALFDESCLLEVPENRTMLQSSLPSQKPYSILAEDLAVSLTIPSPLKSDSHLSFLQPTTTCAMSTPDSIISAHINEDALIDGEDATEQDIHLALDTDNSSCSSSVASEATPFVFKPDLRMQALVMEKSNDHFVVKIRQATTGTYTTLNADDSLSQTLTEEDEQQRQEGMTIQSQVLTDKSQNKTPSNGVPSGNKLSGLCQTSTVSDSERGFTHAKEDTSSTLENDQWDCDRARKRKKHQEKSKAKWPRRDEEKSADEVVFDCNNDNSECKCSPTSPSSSSLYAKNVIKKKGEVVMAWTRGEDRAILIELKTKGASRETFSALSEKLSKPSEQIAHRFYQLMKLYKKQEKMDK